MSKSSAGVLLAIASLSLAACANHDWVPGQGVSQLELHQDWRECSSFASGARPNGVPSVGLAPLAVQGAEFGAGIIGYAIGSEIVQNQTFNQCTEARGWQADNVLNVIGTPPPWVPRAPIPRRQLLIRLNPVTPDMAHELHLNPPRGVLLTEVVRGGVASSAGLRSGDVIVGFNGTNVMSDGDFQRGLMQVAPNSVVTAVVWRNNVEQPVQLHF
jgi:S1-C subfamily serine protease